MPTLAAGSSVTATLTDGGVLSLSSNSGEATVTVTPTTGAVQTFTLGPRPTRRSVGPLSEGGTVSIASSTAEVIYECQSGCPASALTSAQVSATQALVSGARIRRKVIVDTDWADDCDDVGSLRLLCWAHNKGIIQIVGVAVSATQANTPASISAVLNFHGIYGVPIASGPLTSNVIGSGNPYSATLIANFPHEVPFPSPGLMNSVALYRSVLAQNVSDGVDIVSLGYFNNLSELFQSAVDGYSSLSGVDLFAAAVRTCWIMAGSKTTSYAETNLTINALAVSSATYVLKNWPSAVNSYWVAFEDGMQTVLSNGGVVPGESDIVRTAYVLFGAQWGRETWGPMIALASIAPTLAAAGMSSVPVSVGFDPATGYNQFTTSAKSPHNLISRTLGDKAYQLAIDNLLAPAYQPAAWVNVADVPGAGTLPKINVVDAANLVSWHVAADIAQSNGSAVSAWADRTGQWPLSQATVGSQPTYATAKSGKAAVQVASGKWLRSAAGFALPMPCTIYCKVNIDGATTGGVGVVVASNGLSNAGRTGGLGTSGTSQPLAYTVSKGVYNTHSSGTALTVGSWQTAIALLQYASVQAYTDTATATATAVSASSVNAILGGLLTVGATGTAGQETFVNGAGIAEIRIYKGTHDSTQRAAVIAQLV